VIEREKRWSAGEWGFRNQAKSAIAPLETGLDVSSAMCGSLNRLAVDQVITAANQAPYATAHEW